MRMPTQPVRCTRSGIWKSCRSGTTGVTLSGSGEMVAAGDDHQRGSRNPHRQMGLMPRVRCDEFAGVVAVFHKFSVRLKPQSQGNPIARPRRGKAQSGFSRERLALGKTIRSAVRRKAGISPFGPGHSLP